MGCGRQPLTLTGSGAVGQPGGDAGMTGVSWVFAYISTTTSMCCFSHIQSSIHSYFLFCGVNTRSPAHALYALVRGQVLDVQDRESWLRWAEDRPVETCSPGTLREDCYDWGGWLDMDLAEAR